MTLKNLNTIAHALSFGMTFDSALATVKTFTDDVDVTAPDDSAFGLILVGDVYGYSLTLEFDENDFLSGLEYGDGDWD